MSDQRQVLRVARGIPASDGAGVRLTRIIGTPQLPDLDPFLLLDEFGTDRPEDYLAGFPDHPHRGFETVTYMLEGRMRHRDNHGHECLLRPGAVQWMTAGRGIVHSEMPEQRAGRMRGFQLWVNLPARDKMVPPRYQEFAPERIPEAEPAPGVRVRIIAGRVGEREGPIRQPATDPLYLDLALDAGARFAQPVADGWSAFAYVFEGAAGIAGRAVEKGEVAVLGTEGEFAVEGGEGGARLILVAGRPLCEPIARHGPFVMNTRQELVQAFADYQAGRF